MTLHFHVPPRRLCLLVCALLALAGCGDKNRDKKVGQALVNVNGTEITTMQLNEELLRANVTPAQQATASKQLLQGLVDRQLLQNAATEERLERDPKVMQAIERARALIVAQAYMQKRLGDQPRPTKDEIAAYYAAHPDFFAKRKSLAMNELILASADLTPTARAAIDKATTLDAVAAWCDAHGIRYARAQSARSTAEIPPPLAAKLLAMPKGDLLLMQEGERSMLVALADVSASPQTLEQATPQIEQALFAKRTREAAEAELARLRAQAKITYLNSTLAAAPAAPAATADGAKTAIERGVAGLK